MMRWRTFAMLAGGVLLLTLLCRYLMAQPGNLANLWLADVLLTALLLRQPQAAKWPLLLCAIAAEWLGQMLATQWFGPLPLPAAPWLQAGGYALGHGLQSLVCATLLRQTGLAARMNGHPVQLLHLLLFAVGVPGAIGASLFASWGALGAGLSWPRLFLPDFLGAALGNVGLLPLALLFRGSLWAGLRRILWQRFVPLSCLVLAMTIIADVWLIYPFGYSVAVLVVAALYLGMTEMALLGFSWLLLTCAMISLSAFLPPPLTHYWQMVFVYLPVVSCFAPALLLAAALHQVRQREQQRREAADQMVAILYHAGEAIITSDAEGKIESFNRAAARVYGVPEYNAIGQHLSRFAPQALLATPGVEQAQTGEWEAIRADGSHFPAEFMVNSMEVAGQRKLITIVRDITERKRMDRLKSDFVSTVSHELRTPLTSIHGGLGLLRGGVLGTLPERAQSIVNIGYGATERLIRLVNDLLDVQKLESGHVELKLETVPLATLLNRALVQDQAYARVHGITLLLQEPLPEVAVMVDLDRFQQVLSNLISNACKFSQSGSQVELGARLLAGERVRISVRDHGSGIPESFRGRMFQKFSQADSSDTKTRGGTGLGLAISKTLVLLMQGELDYQSEPGVGTEFMIDLPIPQGM